MLHHVGQPFGCSNCHNQLVFKTEKANCIICPACQTKNLRLALSETVGLKAEKVREEMSIIKLGTSGAYQERAFEVIGRIQYFFQDSYRNHWHLLFDNGETAWFGDWAGNYSIFQEVNARFTDRFKNVSAGKKLELQQVNYEVEMLDEHRFTLAEGEIHDNYLTHKDFITLYLTHPDGSMALVNVFKNTGKVPSGGKEVKLEALAGQYVTLSDLKLENCRNYDEWR